MKFHKKLIKIALHLVVFVRLHIRKDSTTRTSQFSVRRSQSVDAILVESRMTSLIKVRKYITVVRVKIRQTSLETQQNEASHRRYLTRSYEHSTV